MSRIGKIPVDIPTGVEVALDNQTIRVKGPKGELSKTFSPLAVIKVSDETVVVSPANDSRAAQAHMEQPAQ